MTPDEMRQKQLRGGYEADSEGQPPRAYFCYNDMLALGLLDAAKEAGVNVPWRACHRRL